MPLRLDDLQTPALLIRLDRVRHNVRRMAEHAGGDMRRWRPHVKTAKVPQVMDLLLEAGVQRFKCATTREAAVLLSRGVEPIDLLVAFPHRGANLRRLADIARAHPRHRVSVLTESPEHATEVRGQGGQLGLFVDLDPGYHRTGIPLADRARIHATLDASGSAHRGLHYYDGHLAHGTLAERRAECDSIYSALLDLVHELGDDTVEIITSGTPTFTMALAYPGFADHDHTVSPGTIVYSDLRTEELGVDGFQRAVHVLARVISSPFAGRVTCDAGSKALDAAAGNPCAVVEGNYHVTALTPSEEHLPLRVDKLPGPAAGALLQLAPRHVCPTVNLADEAVLMEGDEIHGIVAVAARGHETTVR